MKTLSRTLLACALASSAVASFGCPKGGSSSTHETKTGPAVAHVGDDIITADEFKKRLDETSPFLRARYNTLERKKEFLENLIRNELLAQEAERRGLDKTPAVREQMKRAMVQELLKQQLDERLSGADISDDELKKFYDAHLDDFVKPEKARIFRIVIDAPKGDAKARAAAKKTLTGLLKDIEDKEKKNDPNAFQATAMKSSSDKQSAPMGGDLRFQTKDDLTKLYSAELANAAFALKNPGEKSPIFESPQGVEVVKLQVKTVALDRKFEESKESIRGRMARERRSKEYDDFVKKLREGGKVTIDDAELNKVTAAEAPGQMPPGMPGMPQGGMMGGQPRPGQPMLAPAPGQPGQPMQLQPRPPMPGQPPAAPAQSK
ncbi:MAG: peptidyl-prolyl cis-trans isomerase [Deltaproteobacteria bacterium]|nr:peptidyl-prolyl cis-trans isomerase [Deltaproteobacteria bacterium]